MAKRLTKGDTVLVSWKPSYYRGDTYSTKATYTGKDSKGLYMLKTSKGVHHTKDRKMFKIVGR